MKATDSSLSLAVSELSKQKELIKSYSPNDLAKITGVSREALRLSQEIYEVIQEQSRTPEPILEILRINIRAFTLTVNKVEDSPFENTMDFKEICESFIQTFQVLISNSGEEVD